MWKDRVEHANDVWALYLGHTIHLTVRCMSALYRLQALQGEAMSQLMGLVESTKITLDNQEDLIVDFVYRVGGKGSPRGADGQPHTRA
jgi:hypothetical protein